MEGLGVGCEVSSRPEPSRSGCQWTSSEPPPLLLSLHKAPICREASSLPSEGPGAPAPVVLRSRPCSASQLRPLCLWLTQLPVPSLPPPTPAPSRLLLLGLHCVPLPRCPLWALPTAPWPCLGQGSWHAVNQKGPLSPGHKSVPGLISLAFFRTILPGGKRCPGSHSSFCLSGRWGPGAQKGPQGRGCRVSWTPFSSVHPSHTPRPWPALCPSLLPPSLGILTALFSLPGTHPQDG